MTKSEFKRIKEKILTIDPLRWWGDDYDIRFYLINELKKIKNKIILDVGGGIGIISSELDSSNFRINLDMSFDDLKKCQDKVDNNIENICASMTSLPFVNSIFDNIISANILEVAKSHDIKNNNITVENSVNSFPNVNHVLYESFQVLKKDGILFITTPNNAYFQGNKMNYLELKNALSKNFSNHKLWFYNTYSGSAKKNRKLNLANVLPKFLGKTMNDQKILKKLIMLDVGKEKQSVWFYVEAQK